MSATKLLVCCWLALVVLSIASVELGSAGSTLMLSLGVLTAALVKAWIITDGFMELRHAPPLWRNLLMAWPLVMVAGILIAQML